MKIRRQPRNWNKTDPEEYFHKHYAYIKRRRQLKDEDCGLYRILWLRDKLRETIPETRESRGGHRLWRKKNPVDYFHKHYSHIKSRQQLQDADRAFYGTLLRIGKLEELLPETFSGRDWSKLDPLKYFHKHYPSIANTRQLRQKDCGLLFALTKAGKLHKAFPNLQTRRDWSTNDPVKYFRKHYSHIKTRHQLRKADSGLFGVLTDSGKLDIVLPPKWKPRNWKKTDPVRYYHKHYRHIKTRRQLYEEDQGLHDVLRRSGKIEEVLPKKCRRDWSNMNPVKYFKQNCSHIKSRAQLYREDIGLYEILRKTKQLERLLPETVNRDWSRIDAVEFFHEHFAHVKNRAQLYREDSGLYAVLKRTGKLNKVLPSRKPV